MARSALSIAHVSIENVLCERKNTSIENDDELDSVSRTRTPVAFVFKIFIKIQRPKVDATRMQT